MGPLPLAAALVLAVVGVAPARAQDRAPDTAFDVAVDEGDWEQAAEILDRQVAQRDARSAPLRPEPSLAVLAGRLAIATGRPEVALPYLDQALSGQLSSGERYQALIAIADARVASGQPEEARQALEEAATIAPTAPARSRARAALAALLLPADPASALREAGPLRTSDVDPAIRFEAERVAAAAHGLLGDLAAARAAADAAWALAPELPPRVGAPARAALVQAGVSAAAGDSRRMGAMLEAARAGTVDAAAGDYLPLCGEHGLVPSDFVTFLIEAGRGMSARLLPVAASRPQAVAPFFRELSGRSLVPTAARPQGTAFTVRCRSAPSPRYDIHPQPDPLARWLAERGLYLGHSWQLDDEAVGRLRSRMGEVERRHGSDDPRLVPALFDLAHRLHARGLLGNRNELDEALELQERAFAIIRSHGGADAVPDEAVAALFRTAWKSLDPEHWRLAVHGWGLQLISEAEPGVAYSALVHWFDQDPSLSEAQKLQLVEGLLARFADPADPRRRALLVRQGDLHRTAGDFAAARRSYRDAGLARTHCFATDESLTVESGAFSAEDYPRLPQMLDLAGVNLFEFSITREGAVRDMRFLVSSPSLLFDAITLERFGAYRYRPPRLDGRAYTCTGAVQRTVWHLQDENQLQLPDFGPPELTPL